MTTLQEAIDKLHLEEALRDVADIVSLEPDIPLDTAVEILKNARSQLPDRFPGSNAFTRLDRLIIPLWESQRGMANHIGPLNIVQEDTSLQGAANISQDVVLLRDLNHQLLLNDASELLRIQYLSATNQNRSPPYSGILWHSSTCRPLVSLPCRIRDTMLNVTFMVDTGSPVTTMCMHVFQAFGFHEHIPSKTMVSINGTPMLVELSKPKSIYDDINLIGADFLRATHSFFTCDYHKMTCKIEPKHVHDDM